MVRLELEVLCDAGPVEVAQITVKQGMRLVVGRVPDRADVAFPSDLLMSSCHLKLTGDAQGFSISDLRSTNGTFVNGVRLQGERRLVHGDEIAAGQTRFLVALAVDDVEATATPPPAQETAPSPSPAAAEPLAAKPAATDPSSRPAEVPAAAEQAVPGAIVSHRDALPTLPPCATYAASEKIAAWRGQIFDITPVEAVRRLRGRWNAHLLLDRHRAHLELSAAELDAASLPTDAQGSARQTLLLPLASDGPWQSLLEENWNQDAMVCLFSSLETATLRLRLGPFLPLILPAAAEAAMPAPRDSGLPSCFRELLERGSDRGPAIFEMAQAVLLESAQPEFWTLYLPAEHEAELRACGFTSRDNACDVTA